MSNMKTFTDQSIKDIIYVKKSPLAITRNNNTNMIDISDYYNSDNKEYAISDTQWSSSYKYYTNVDILNDFINVPSDQFYMANKYYKELSIGSGIYTLAT